MFWLSLVGQQLLADGLGGLQEQMQTLISRSGLDTGVAIEDLESGERFFIHPDTSYPIGASARIHLISELFRQDAAGKLPLSSLHALPASAQTGGLGVLRFMTAGSVTLSLRDYATLIVTAHDNTAANFLTDLIGINTVNASLAAQGTPEIQFRRRAVSRREAPDAPENVATPRASLRALRLLYDGQVVDRPTSDAIVELLSLPELTYNRRDLPPTVRFAGLSGFGPGMRSDQGIVRLKQRPYVFCAMVRGGSVRAPRSTQLSEADALMAALFKAAYVHFSRPSAGPQ